MTVTLLHCGTVNDGCCLIIVCAWCEREGRPAVLYKTVGDSSTPWETRSHGICTAHRDQLLLEMRLSLVDAVPASLATSIQESIEVEWNGAPDRSHA